MYLRYGTNPRLLRVVVGPAATGNRSRVIEREYFVRQAMWFLKFAKSIKNPELAAALIEKAADLHSQTDETIPQPDTSPQAPDIEPRT